MNETINYKKFLFWSIFFIIIFSIGYFGTSLAVKATLSDEKYKESLTVTTYVEGLKVEDYEYMHGENIQPAYNINKLNY